MNTKQKSKQAKAKSTALVAQTQSSTRNKSGQQRKNRNRGKTSTELVSRICGLTDPFCDHAIGAKYPDDSSVRTLPFTYRSLETVVSGAGGADRRYANLQYQFQPWHTANVSSGSTVTSWNNSVTNTVIPGASMYRIVSAGFILRRIAAPLYASGSIHIRTYGFKHMLNLNGVDLVTYNSSNQLDIPYQDCNELCVVFQHSDEMPQLFYETNFDTDITSDEVTHGFFPVSIFAIGVPASTAIYTIETIIHYELTFEVSSGLAQAATPPPPANHVITGLSNRVSSIMKPIFEHGKSEVGRYLQDKAKGAISKMLFGPVVGTALARLVD